jgi:crotonobetainyl-CoA:carnitine CoA-transferase CaiB-like acyl-CoA transferase
VEKTNQSPFSAIKVIECGQGIAAAFATKLLADLGADVVKVEPPDGDVTRRRGPFPNNQPDPEKSGVFTYLNTNKRGVAIDLTAPKGIELISRLIADADILVHNVAPRERDSQGLDSASLCTRYPRLVVAAISAFGESGPYAGFKGFDLTAANAGGWAFVSPGASPYPDLPPLRCFGDQCDYQAGVHAAMATLAAYFNCRRSGKGQLIDVSEQEVVTALIENNLLHYTYAQRVASRLGDRIIGPWFITDCADGQIFVIAVEEDQWKRLVELNGQSGMGQ